MNSLEFISLQSIKNTIDVIFSDNLNGSSKTTRRIKSKEQNISEV